MKVFARLFPLTGLALTASLLALPTTTSTANETNADWGDDLRCFVTPDAAQMPTDRSRTINTLFPYDGKIYYGYGDYNANTGSSTGKGTNVSFLDPLTGEFGVSFEGFRTEEVNTFREYDGSLYVPNIDPSSGAGLYNGYVTDEGGEGVFRGVKGGIQSVHVYDVAKLGDLTFVAGANQGIPSGNPENWRAVVWVSEDGVNFTESLTDTHPEIEKRTGFERFYWLGVLDGKVYARATTNNNTPMQVFDPAVGVWAEAPGVPQSFGVGVYDAHDMLAWNGRLWQITLSDVYWYDGESSGIIKVKNDSSAGKYWFHGSVSEDGENLYLIDYAQRLYRVDYVDDVLPEVDLSSEENAVHEAEREVNKYDEMLTPRLAARDRVANELLATEATLTELSNVHGEAKTAEDQYESTVHAETVAAHERATAALANHDLVRQRLQDALTLKQEELQVKRGEWSDIRVALATAEDAATAEREALNELRSEIDVLTELVKAYETRTITTEKMLQTIERLVESVENAKAKAVAQRKKATVKRARAREALMKARVKFKNAKKVRKPALKKKRNAARKKLVQARNERQQIVVTVRNHNETLDRLAGPHKNAMNNHEGALAAEASLAEVLNGRRTAHDEQARAMKVAVDAAAKKKKELQTLEAVLPLLQEEIWLLRNSHYEALEAYRVSVNSLSEAQTALHESQVKINAFKATTQTALMAVREAEAKHDGLTVRHDEEKAEIANLESLKNGATVTLNSAREELRQRVEERDARVPNKIYELIDLDFYLTGRNASFTVANERVWLGRTDGTICTLPLENKNAAVVY